MVKNPPIKQETQVQALGQEDTVEKGMATHYTILPWRIPWTEEPDGLYLMGSQRVRHDWATNTFTFMNKNCLFCKCSFKFLGTPHTSHPSLSTASHPKSLPIEILEPLFFRRTFASICPLVHAIAPAAKVGCSSALGLGRRMDRWEAVPSHPPPAGYRRKSHFSGPVMVGIYVLAAQIWHEPDTWFMLPCKWWLCYFPNTVRKLL